MASNLSLDVRGYNVLKGFRTTAKVFKSDTPSFNEKSTQEKGELDLNPKLQQQLMDLLDYCKEQKLHVLFVRAPHYVTEDTYDRVKRSNKMASIVREYGYSYYACENEAVKIGIDDKRDFYNEDHMNVYGALKFTDYLAEKDSSKPKNLKIDPRDRFPEGNVGRGLLNDQSALPLLRRPDDERRGKGRAGGCADAQRARKLLGRSHRAQMTEGGAL